MRTRTATDVRTCVIVPIAAVTYISSVRGSAPFVVTIAEIVIAIAGVIEVTRIEIHGDLRWVQLWRALFLREAKVD